MDEYGVKEVKIQIHGAKTLTRFTNELLSGFDSAEGADFSFEVFQIHASPNSINEDLEILEKMKKCNLPKVCLLHRPDELLLHPGLKNFLETHPETNLILLGDLLLKDQFWNSREKFITVIPHFYFSTALPSKNEIIFGSFTSWGEMRNLRHFENLVSAVEDLNSNFEIKYKIGGTLNGIPLTSDDLLTSDIEISTESFIPHFNVQLYHLNGHKRFGESSGSLHSGVSIPVIFEANGMERIEGLNVIKVEASDDLLKINYEKAAREIIFLIEQQALEKLLSQNLKSARMNTAVDFANQVISIVSSK